jgi:UDP-N-acetyl-D-galactosamine dehydrogenase
LYKSVITAGTHLAPSIKVAEAAKVIENSQRDINIAFVNELAKIFNLMNIDTHAVWLRLPKEFSAFQARASWWALHRC